MNSIFSFPLFVKGASGIFVISSLFVVAFCQNSDILKVTLQQVNSMKKEHSPDSGHSFEDYFKRAISPMLVLHLLSQQPMYVYQMQQELSRRSQGRYTLSLLYPVLYRLVKLGYVKEGGKQISPDNRVRQYYAITPTGTDYLAALRGEYQQLQLAVQQIMGGEKST